ncbi:MAG: hypothetical protein QOD75_112 [Blastocatellia bacterium]|jgi:hypothetical protein|nr:hypothetical protein [Blastocatellia bacterium]
MSPNSFQQVPQVSSVTPEPGKQVENVTKSRARRAFPARGGVERSLPLIELKTMNSCAPTKLEYSAQPVRGYEQ